MCDPVSIGLAAVSAAASLGGSMMQISAANKAASATQQQDIANMTAQNTAFQQRNQAALAQTDAQFNAQEATMNARNAAFTQMRGQQSSAIQQYQDQLAAQNQQADALRAQGDTAAQQLTTDTSGSALADAQTAAVAQAAGLLRTSDPTSGGPQATDPSGNPIGPSSAAANDPTARAALASRTAQAATNIRTYGSEIGKLQSYSAPISATDLAIQANKYGIMPAQAAETLLQSGSATRLLPSKINYMAATTLGDAQDKLIQAKGQGALDTAGLTYGNAVDIANLSQSNADTLAKNQADQAKADAAAQAAMGGMVSNVGNLAAYGAGYTSGINPSTLGSKISGIFGFGAPNADYGPGTVNGPIP